MTGGPQAHNDLMAVTAQTQTDMSARWHDVVPVGLTLIAAELLLALLWYPWVAEHLAFGSSLPYDVLRVLIVAPEYLLLVLAVHLIGLTHDRRVAAVSCALLAGLVAWGVPMLISHLAPTPSDLARHRGLLTFADDAMLFAVPLLAALAWGLARRQGRWWLLAALLAPLLHYWIENSEWPLSLRMHLSFRGSETVGMSLVILPVLLAILTGWAVEQVQGARSATI